MSIDAGLYQITLEGDIWDKETKYQLVIVTKFDSVEQTAKEVGHKAFYIKASAYDIEKYFRKDTKEKLALMYAQKEHSRFEIEFTEKMIVITTKEVDGLRKVGK